MKLIAYVALALALVLGGCTSSRKHLQRGEYETAFRKAVKKLQQDPSRKEEMEVLKEAFSRGQQADAEKINFLKKEGRPDNWESIAALYTQMKDRQELARTVLPANYGFVNYDAEIIESRQRAATYLYTHSMELLDKNNRFDARKAHAELLRVKDLYPVFRDVDDQLRRAKEAGMTHVLLRVESVKGLPLPPGLGQELIRLELQGLNKRWVRYSTVSDNSSAYHYLIRFTVTSIAVSPESVREKRYTDTKKIEDGWEYVLDKKGNVQKDSLGNDIKVRKYKEISCTVIENCQSKSARITAAVDFIDAQRKEVLRSAPAVADAFFDNESAIAQGELKALSEESRRKLNRAPVPFPPNLDLIFNAGVTLRGVVRNIIASNEGLFN
jgi:hypothetical protein